MQAEELLAEKREINALVREKAQIGAKLSAASAGGNWKFLLEDCEDLSDMIDEVSDISSKRSEKEHAAFESKIKFSRKIRRKAKDLNKFEQWLVQEYDSKHITLEHGRKMVSIVKLLRSSKAEKARKEAEEFYSFLEMGARLGIVDELLSKKKAQVERAKRGVSAQLSDWEWLEKEPAPDLEKAIRYDDRMKLEEKLGGMRLDCIRQLQSMPMGELLAKISERGLDKLGFPEVAHQDAFLAYLRKAGLDAKTSGQLYELAGQSEQRLRHLGIDLAAFREVVARKDFLRQVMNLHSTDFLAGSNPPSLAYLSGQSQEARDAAERLFELEKTQEEDKMEWARAKKIGQKKAELAGVEKPALVKLLQELEELENILEGKVEVAAPSEEKKEKNIVGSILKFFGGK